MIWEWASDGRALVLMASETIGRGSRSGLNDVDRRGLVLMAGVLIGRGSWSGLNEVDRPGLV
jgi:hypothetical protein